jgi:hypothetical protein
VGGRSERMQNTLAQILQRVIYTQRKWPGDKKNKNALFEILHIFIGLDIHFFQVIFYSWVIE